MPLFQSDGVKLNYRDEGSGLPFFFQHGLGADLTQPFGLLKAPPGVRLIAFDARAHGQSPVGSIEKIGLAASADDLLTLMDHLQIPQAIVGGISMGAAVTLNFALRNPKRLLGLVQSRPAWLDRPNPWNVTMFSLVSRLVRENGRVRGKELFLESTDYRETLAKWPDVANSLAAQFDHPEVEETAFKFERIILDSPSGDRREWSNIAVPTLVLANRFDPIHPYEYALELRQLIPAAEFQEITAKSISVEQHNADVQRCLDDFLRRRFLERGSDGNPFSRQPIRG
jgi:pimeloyl-ACP methyl ester carboxylesterase